MTRKRYIKLLMSLDVSRNRANELAYKCQTAGVTYEADYRRRKPWLRLAISARKASAHIANTCKELRNVVEAVRKLQAGLVMHHPFCPDTRQGGNVSIMTRQEHDRLHGYSAQVSYVDELHTPQRADALDALRYAALVAGRGNSRNAVGPGTVTFSTVPVAELEKQEVAKDET